MLPQCEGGQADIARKTKGFLADAAFPLLIDEGLPLLSSAAVRLFLIHDSLLFLKQGLAWQTGDGF